jgi:mitochondrial inner membrane protease subunit 1
MLMDVHTRPSHSRMFIEKAPPPLPPPIPPSESSIGEWQLLSLLMQRMAMALGIVHCWTEYVMDITLCSGPSMLPTIQESNEIVLLDRFAIWRGVVHDGTTAASRIQAAHHRQQQHRPIYVWHQPIIPVSQWNDIKLTWRQAWEHFCSPISVGDVVVSQNPNRPGTICKRVVGLPGDQVILLNGGMILVPDHHVWLEGDNPSNSMDSRQSGPIPMAMLRGRTVARVWPLRAVAWMRRGAPPTAVDDDMGHYSKRNHGSIVLPAGYNGEHIVRHMPLQEPMTTESGES